jgi:uncharacterized SAM-binding protein YcdF (DUF218 family)
MSMRFVAKAVLVGVLAYAAGFLLFVAGLPRKPSGPLQGDAIVALTGGGARLDAAVALFEGGAGKRLLISGVNSTTTKADLKKLNHGGPRFDCCADLGRDAADTHGNATETARWAVAHHYKSLILVTAGYHMPRSLTEFSKALPGVKLVSYPVEPAELDLNTWWKPGTIRLLHGEYARYLASLVTTAMNMPIAHANASTTRLADAI